MCSFLRGTKDEMETMDTLYTSVAMMIESMSHKKFSDFVQAQLALGIHKRSEGISRCRCRSWNDIETPLNIFHLRIYTIR